MDREKVIKGLECLTQMTSCIGCPYWDSGRTRKECLSHIGEDAIALLKDQPQIVRCKDCKHRPLEPNWETYESGFDLEFPDNECLCQCSGDGWYSWYPSDDWFCPKGEHT